MCVSAEDTPEAQVARDAHEASGFRLQQPRPTDGFVGTMLSSTMEALRQDVEEESAAARKQSALVDSGVVWHFLDLQAGNSPMRAQIVQMCMDAHKEEWDRATRPMGAAARHNKALELLRLLGDDEVEVCIIYATVPRATLEFFEAERAWKAATKAAQVAAASAAAAAAEAREMADAVERKQAIIRAERRAVAHLASSSAPERR